MRPAAYRYPGESSTLYGTLFLVFLIIAVTSTATFFSAALLVALVVAITYTRNRSQHENLMSQGVLVSSKTLPELNKLVESCAKRLNVKDYEVYVTRNRQRNAYTFGLHNPRVIVLYSSLLEIMDRDELAFIIGHEMGHIRLGHTHLNSLLGGMAGIPSSSFFSAILNYAFLKWNRSCEYSADRAGMLVNGNPQKAISALLKLITGKSGMSEQDLQKVYQQVDAQDSTWLGNFSEVFATHPLISRRIEQIQQYAQSPAYKKLIAKMQ